MHVHVHPAANNAPQTTPQHRHHLTLAEIGNIESHQPLMLEQYATHMGMAGQGLPLTAQLSLARIPGTHGIAPTTQGLSD